jgi:DNA-directed RNA polymerase specialized sigma24 family protein
VPRGVAGAAVLEEAEPWTLVSGRDAEILTMDYQEGLSEREIGERMGVTEAAVCKRRRWKRGEKSASRDERALI